MVKNRFTKIAAQLIQSNDLNIGLKRDNVYIKAQVHYTPLENRTVVTVLKIMRKSRVIDLFLI